MLMLMRHCQFCSFSVPQAQNWQKIAGRLLNSMNPVERYVFSFGTPNYVVETLGRLLGDLLVVVAEMTCAPGAVLFLLSAM